ncbi:MAG: trehalose-phosphatase [Xanthobacteraceae bacterium]|nr:trehalose-phosphatase [Xanthobacteraceae bacterium]
MPLDGFDLRADALLLDVDGTLLDIAPTPQSVEVPAELVRTLLALGERTGGALALVSGRPLDDIDRLFHPLEISVVAGHGAELRIAGARAVQLAGSLPAALKRRLQAIADERNGVIAEDKGYAFALHYRLALDRAEEVWEAVGRACAAFQAGSLEILPGKAVIEVKGSAFDKGTGVREIMKLPPFRDRRPIFIGDDVTDQAAVAVMPEFGGLAFSVGREMQGAAGMFGSPDDVRGWLGALARTAATAS